jgi:hypothetical protein
MAPSAACATNSATPAMTPSRAPAVLQTLQQAKICSLLKALAASHVPFCQAKILRLISVKCSA